MDYNKELNRLTKKYVAEITDTDLLLSPGLREYLQDMVDAVTIGKKIKLITEFDDAPDACVAYTNGDCIHLNTGNHISGFYSLMASKLIALSGIAFHEIGHCNFMDFNTENKVSDTIQAGKLYGDIIANTTDEEEWLDEIYEALEDTCTREIFVSLYHNFSNIMADVHDEAKMIHTFHGLVEKGLTFSTEALRSTSATLEQLTMAVEEQKHGILEVMLSLMLQFARYGEVIVENDTNLLKNKYYNKLTEIAPLIVAGTTTDNIVEKYTCINQCILMLWPYIKEELESDDTQKQNGNAGSQNTSGNSGSHSGQKQTSASTQPNVNSVLQSISNAVSNAVPKSAPVPENKKTQRNKTKREQAASKGEGLGTMNDETAQQIMQNVINQIKNSVSENKAHGDIEKMIDNNTNVIINSVNMSSTHKGRSTYTVRVGEPSANDKQLYDTVMKDLKPVSKSLQRQMLNAIKEMQEGSIQKHRVFGTRLESRDTYRLDYKCYSKVNLPQDVPSMVISVLIDQSGSTCGERIKSAQKASMLLHDFAVGLNIPIMVCGHHTAYDGIKFYVYTDFDHIGEKDRYRMSQINSHPHGNRDGMAINIAADLLSKRPEDIKLLLVLSDGQPADRNYGGEEAVKDIQDIIRRYKHKGITTIGTAIGDDRDRIREIYKEGYLDISELSALPKTMVKIVKKRIL